MTSKYPIHQPRFIVPANAKHANTASGRQCTQPNLAGFATLSIATTKRLLGKYKHQTSGDKEFAALVQEFISIDGVGRLEAEAIAAVSIPTKSSEEWLSMIVELDGLINRYFTLHSVSPENRALILSARARQAHASIPETLAWFKTAIESGPKG